MTTTTSTNTNIDIASVQLSKKFIEANVRFQAAWTQWLDDARSWAIYLNEIIDILHYEHPDWSIRTISRVIRVENDGLRGFGETTIYRHLNNDNKALLDLRQQQRRKGKTTKSGFHLKTENLEDEDSSSSKASPERKV